MSCLFVLWNFAWTHEKIVFVPLFMRVPAPCANLPRSLASAFLHMLASGPFIRSLCSSKSPDCCRAALILMPCCMQFAWWSSGSMRLGRWSCACCMCDGGLLGALMGETFGDKNCVACLLSFLILSLFLSCCFADDVFNAFAIDRFFAFHPWKLWLCCWL